MGILLPNKKTFNSRLIRAKSAGIISVDACNDLSLRYKSGDHSAYWEFKDLVYNYKDPKENEDSTIIKEIKKQIENQVEIKNSRTVFFENI